MPSRRASQGVSIFKKQRQTLLWLGMVRKWEVGGTLQVSSFIPGEVVTELRRSQADDLHRAEMGARRTFWGLCSPRHEHCLQGFHSPFLFPWGRVYRTLSGRCLSSCSLRELKFTWKEIRLEVKIESTNRKNK